MHTTFGELALMSASVSVFFTLEPKRSKDKSKGRWILSPALVQFLSHRVASHLSPSLALLITGCSLLLLSEPDPTHSTYAFGTSLRSTTKIGPRTIRGQSFSLILTIALRLVLVRSCVQTRLCASLLSAFYSGSRCILHAVVPWLESTCIKSWLNSRSLIPRSSTLFTPARAYRSAIAYT
jgi:hypothetical protein